MFSDSYYNEIKAGFEEQMALLDKRCEELSEDAGADSLSASRLVLLREKREEIRLALARCSEDEAQALTFLYSAMPISDLLDYPAALFLAYAKHGVFLWHHGPFAGQVPERLFANYVLHHRINNEDIADTRGFFYDRVIGQVEGKDMFHAIVEANYWCAREATYRSTDGRTQNPRTMFGTAMGRCGEESTMGVTTLRSIGIPARQVYAPLWSHCDDNHAWVEVWCEGTWRFLGACEPEEKLNRGWFTGPASRAMLLHSRWFGKDEPQDPVVGRKGMSRVLNHLARYAHTAELTLKIVDEAGDPVPSAKAVFQVLNYGRFGTVAVICAGESGEDCGVVRLTTGQGDLYVSASGRGLCGEMLLSLTDKTAAHTLVLKKEPECTNGFVNLDFHAPALGHIHNESLTPQEESVGAAKLEAAAAYRQKKAAGFYDEREAARVLGRFDKEEQENLQDILKKAHSNMGELVRFLEWDASAWLREDWPAGRTDRWKLEVLKALREKDWWDIRAEILIDCCKAALPYAGTIPDEIFYKDLVCPRAANEMVRLCRTALAHLLSPAEAEAFRQNPAAVAEWVQKKMISMPDQEYEDLVTSPFGCLRGGIASRHSQAVFGVNLCRSLGIPARLRPMDLILEYYQNGQFVAVGQTAEENCRLTLCGSESLKLSDWEHYSVERWEDGHFEDLWLGEQLPEDESTEELEISLAPGIYRIVTVNRRQSGDQLAAISVFALEKGEQKRVVLSLREIPVDELLTRKTVTDFSLKEEDGGSRTMAGLTGESRALFVWLEVTREPTEHILNELFEKQEEYAALSAPLYAVLRAPADRQNKTLARTLKALPQIRILYDDFGESYRTLAKEAGQEPGRLPLAVVMESGSECIYSDCGYNVGMADMLLRILSEEG